MREISGRFTVLGANGFIGRNLVRHLRLLGAECFAVGRGEPTPPKPGHLIYAIGMTSGFRTRPLETADAHITELTKALHLDFESLTYLSSTRVYLGLPTDAIASEDTTLWVNPNLPDHLYNLTKLAGESLCLSHPRGRVVRLSNVYGPDDTSDNFLTGMLRRAKQTGGGELRISLDSSKDYVSIEDVIAALAVIPTCAHRIVNVASGVNVSNANVVAMIETLTRARIEIVANAPRVSFPRISITRLTSLGIVPSTLKIDWCQTGP